MNVELQNNIHFGENPNFAISRLQPPSINNDRTTTKERCFLMKPIVRLVSELVGRGTKKPDTGHPLTSKGSSRQKTNERSNRSIKRKLELEKYTSESLEKLNLSHRAHE
jgi:hypothetical protein